MEEYVYDGDGKRIKKIDAASERIYIYSGLNVLYEVNTTTQMDAIYLYGPTGKIAKKVNDITEYYHTDHLGSTKLVTSENGTVTEEIQYEPFGEQINTTEEKYTYNGKERDETGLYYYGARYYDPAIGRFTTKDILAGKRDSPQNLNKYVYCLNNPLTYIDPTGNKSDPVWDAINNINWSLIPFDEIQKLIDEGDLFGALILLVEALMEQGLPFLFIKDEEGNISNIVYAEKLEGGGQSMIGINVVNKEQFLKEKEIWYGDNMNSGFSFEMDKEGYIYSAAICIFDCIKDAKDLANALVHECIHAHDFLRVDMKPSALEFYLTDPRANWWSFKNWFKMRWPFI